MSKLHMVKAAVILLLLIFLSGCVDPDPPENVIRYAVNVTEDGVIEISLLHTGLSDLMEIVGCNCIVLEKSRIGQPCIQTVSISAGIRMLLSE
jgi:hypothetical protein